MFETIKFENIEYSIRELNFPFGVMLISTDKLSDALMDENCEYVSEKAMFVDDHIFYFVEEKDIPINDKTLIAKITSEL